MSTVHIDGDVLVYACGFAAEKGEYVLNVEGMEPEHIQYKKDLDARLDALGNPPHMVEFQRYPEPVEYALGNVKTLIRSILEATGADNYRVYLSGPTNFRESIATVREYKGNRDKTHKPVHGPAIREYLVQRHDAVFSVDEECDDLLAKEHFKLYSEDMESSVIATIDKDLDMIPGWHYNFKNEQLYYVFLEEANYLFYKQLLTGDTVDNIVGIPKVGPAKAEKILVDCKTVPEMYQACRAAYQKAYGDKADEVLLEMARLLWIRRKDGELWEPPILTT